MMRPEEMTESNMPRPAYKVSLPGGGSDLAGSMVAAFAAGSIAFQTTGKCTQCLRLAQTQLLTCKRNTLQEMAVTCLFSGKVKKKKIIYIYKCIRFAVTNLHS